MSSSVVADAKFLRRVLMGLVLLTLFTGGMAAVAASQALSGELSSCTVFCQ
jgi:hypothetical protein